MRPDSPRYQAARVRHWLLRRRWRSRIDACYQRLLDDIDQAAFRDRFRPFWDPFAGPLPAKFLHLDVWLKEAVFRCLLLGLDRPPHGQRVLDLGAGTGYFLLTCRHLGHDVLGLDLPGEPLYDAFFHFFGLPRILHRIEPHQPLPDLGPPLDLITAFMTCFNLDQDQRPWPAAAWTEFLQDVRSRLAPGGRLVLKFNLEPDGRRFYSPQVRQALHSAAGFRTRFFLDYARLEAR